MSEKVELDDDLRDDLGWHALNYRTAHTVHAESMWVELKACVDRLIAAEVRKETERCAARVALHSQYPIATEFDRGYDKSRMDASEKLLKLLKS